MTFKGQNSRKGFASTSSRGKMIKIHDRVAPKEGRNRRDSGVVLAHEDGKLFVMWHNGTEGHYSANELRLI